MEEDFPMNLAYRDVERYHSVRSSSEGCTEGSAMNGTPRARSCRFRVWGEAGIHVAPADSTIPLDRALPPTGLIHSARMRGREMRDADGVFTQFHEALRLPDCFRWN